MTMIQVIAFDVYGTLLNIHSIQLILEKYLPGKGMQASTIIRDKQIEYTRIYTMSQNRIPYVNFMDLTISAINYTFQYFGKELDDKQFKEIVECYKKLNTFSEVRSVLNQLNEQNIKFVVLSNANEEMLQETLANSGLVDVFSNVFSAASIPTFKTDHRVYSMVSNHFNCSLKDCLLVSSNYWDILGGGWAGMKTFWVNRHSLPRDPLNYSPNYEGKSLNDLMQTIQTENI